MKKIYNSYSQIAKSIDLMDEETLVDICLDIVGSKIEEIGETYTDEYLEYDVICLQLPKLIRLVLRIACIRRPSMST